MAAWSDYSPSGPWNDGQQVTRTADGVIFTYDATLNALHIMSNVGAAAKNAGGFSVQNLANPTNPQDAATKSYIDAAIAKKGWQGTYAVAANTPDLSTVTPVNGQFWTATTASPTVPETLTIALPPLAVGTSVSNSDTLLFDGTNWHQNKTA